MKDKFLVRIPIDVENPAGECREVKFKTRKEVTDFLQISMNNLVSMLNHGFKCVYSKHKHLKGITIHKIQDDIPDEPVDPVEFRRTLLEKITNC